ncbi:Flagellar biosynthesis protein FlhA [Buchnera aphidicola (Takecallis arundicolens)]|uniref:FHIPEP family type III secretion protein n=1 Tax=Buchnera aphidicola TaxID=9 RepID=UPI0034643463
MRNMFSFIRTVYILLKIKWQAWIGPAMIFMILSMMILPLPSFMLDVLFTFNITMSILVLMVSLFIHNTLEFSVFPTLLLFLTLLRLSLNIASTRIILLKGHTGSFSAGHVIESFGYFLVEGNFSVGIIIFMILVIINFIVITKGAGRVAEVSARFMLDGMPGKQMAIDSDLNSGLISAQQAKIRRIKVAQEANFYGAMDGASKFVRGDAIAGILIMIINIFGGLIIGIIEHNMKFYEASKIYTLLTIGDGLVAQIPALIISIAAGVIVTRVSTNQNVSEQMIEQIFYHPQVFILSSLFLVIFGLIPGMPNLIFLLFSVALMIIAYFVYYLKYVVLNTSSVFEPKISDEHNKQDISWNEVNLEDLIRIELGVLLLSMINIDNRNNLFIYIIELRKKFAKQIGFLPDIIHISFSNNLPKFSYRILIKGVEYGTGRVFLSKFIAICTKNVIEPVLGDHVIDPIFKDSVIWISPKLYYKAKKDKYNIMYPQYIIIMHLENILLTYSQDLFGRNEVQKLLDYISLKMPKLIEELIPNMISITCLQQILQNLLLEQIPIRDMRTILETLIEYSTIYKNPDELTSVVRVSLRKFITQHFFPNQNKIHVIGLDLNFENFLLKMMHSGKSFVEPISTILLSNIRKSIEKQHSINAPLIILVRNIIRYFVSSIFRKYFPKLIILSDLEISDDKNIIITSFIKMD